mgnify:CR=1 FL=1
MTTDKINTKVKTLGTLGVLVATLFLQMNSVSAEPIKKDFSNIKTYNRNNIFVRNDEQQLEIPKQSLEFGLVNQGVHYKPIKCGKLLDKRVQKEINNYFTQGVEEHYSSLQFCEQESQDCLSFVQQFLSPQIKKAGKLGYNFLHVWINKKGEGIVNFNRQIIIIPKEYAILTALMYDKSSLTEVINSKKVSPFRKLGHSVQAAYDQYKTAINLLIAGATAKELTN